MNFRQPARPVETRALVIRTSVSIIVFAILASTVVAQTTSVSPFDPGVNAINAAQRSDTGQAPLTIRLAGRLTNGSNPSGTVAGVRFSIYADEVGGLPLWSGTQNIQLDGAGRYSAILGNTPNLLPLDIFVSGTARWIEVLSDGFPEPSRIQIVSVPYALKSANADLLEGHPASDFLLAQSAVASAFETGPVAIRVPTSMERNPMQASVFESTSEEGPSFISDALNGPPFQVNSPILVPNLNADLLHGLPADAFAQLVTTNTFQSRQFLRGGLSALPTTQSRAGDVNGQSSTGIDLIASAFNAQTSKAVDENFRWQTEAVGSNSVNPSGRLSLLFGSDGGPLTETGFSFNPDGTANLVPNQQVPLSSIQTALTSAGLTDPVSGGPSESPVVNTGSYQWQQTPANSSSAGKNHTVAISPGPNTVTLSPCPKGVNGTDVWHYLYLSGSGTPEAVLITGGSCTSSAISGTISFSAVNKHSAGYTIGTATAGVQEAIEDAVVPQSTGSASRNVQMSPGTLVFNARLSIRSSGLTVTGTGTTITCAVQDTCIMLGDPINASFANNITLGNIMLSPGIPRSAFTAVEDNAQGSTINNLVSAGNVKGNSFKSFIQVDNDQAATIKNINTNPGVWGLCDATYCSTAIVGAGPAGTGKNAGVIWISNSNLSSECTANGVDNQDGNSLQISNSVVQAYPQFGVRSEQTYTNSLNVRLDTVYMEIGNCVNPLGTGLAGLIVEGGFANVNTSTGSAGQLPQYSNSGSVPLSYYVVVRSSQMGQSPVYLAGFALSDGVSPISVVWDQVGTAGIITYDLLRVSGNPAAGSTVAPYGTGNFAVATGITTASCSNTVCSFVDNPAATPSTYTVATSFYSPALTLWPAGVVLTTRWDQLNAGGAITTKYITDTLSGNSFVNSEGGFQPSVFAQQCEVTKSWSPIWMQCQEGDGESNDNAAIVGTLIQLSAYGGQTGGLKGRTIYELPGDGSSIPGTEIMTWGDSNVDKTTATSGNRPSWDALDTYVGVDQVRNAYPLNYQLAFGAPISVSNYIGSVPDGVSWKERLTASQKSFTVPLSATKYLTAVDCSSAIGQCNTASTGKFAIGPGATGITIFTTQVTQQSEIHIDENFSYGPLLGVTCDTNMGRHYVITEQVPGESFTVSTDNAPTGGSACLSFSYEN